MARPGHGPNQSGEVPPRTVKTWAGQAGTAGSADGPVATATFNCPLGLALDAAGNLLVADGNNNTIRKITPAGVVSTLAGTAGSVGRADGVGGAARFNYPYALAVDGAGNLWVSENGNNAIRRVTASGQVTPVVGDPDLVQTVPGPLPASLASPAGIAVDAATGTLFIVANNAILTARI